MSSWDIDPRGVQSTVNKTADVAKKLEGVAKGYGTSLESAVNNGGSQIIAEAVKGFVEHHEKSFENIANRTVSVLTGAVNATKAYLDGDLAMAAEAQRNAGTVPERK